jgi:5-methylcytosine-specific restriction endonuclease McrA
MSSIRTLVLTCGEEPHRIVRWEKGICLVVKGKVEVLRSYGAAVPSERAIIRLPAVVKLLRAIPRVHRTVRFGRISVYLRDGFRCCYCDERHPPDELTYDHVIPRDQWRGPAHKLTDWDNIATSCWDCNQRKRNRTPAQAGMKLLRKPHKPDWLPPMPFFMPKDAPKVWAEFLPAVVQTRVA